MKKKKKRNRFQFLISVRKKIKVDEKIRKKYNSMKRHKNLSKSVIIGLLIFM